MDEIKYRLRGVTVDQFATLFEPEHEGMKLNISIPVKTNYEDRAFAVGVNIQFLEDGKPFLVAEVYCHYEIEEKCWNDLTEDGKKEFILPKDTMNNLIRMAVSTARGAICVKTENTPFAKYCLPLIEIGPEEVGEDLVFAKV